MVSFNAFLPLGGSSNSARSRVIGYTGGNITHNSNGTENTDSSPLNDIDVVDDNDDDVGDGQRTIDNVITIIIATSQ